MPLPGGAADKLGNRYELEWTLVCMVEVLAERATSIRLEPPGTEGEGAEFWLRRGATREYHQTKRRHGADGRWNAATLNENAVLSKAHGHLRDKSCEFFFVSESDAVHLREITDHARSAATATEFTAEFLNNKERNREFQNLRRYWGNCTEAEAYGHLRRLYIYPRHESALREIVEARIGPLVDGDVAHVRNALVELASESVHRELTASDIWRHLDQRGFRRRVWHNDPHVLAAVDSANERHLASVRGLSILGHPLPRRDATAAISTLLAADGERGLVLHGEAGIGKSGIVAQVAEGLRQQGVPVLAFRADQLRSTMLPKEIGAQLGLPESPVRVLAAIACDRRSVLLIDQLDAVSELSGRSMELREPIVQLVEEALAHPQMRVVLACRTFDLQHDDRFRALVGGTTPFRRQQVGPLDTETVRMVVGRLGIDPDSLGQDQLRLLSTPLHLKLLEGIAGGSERQVVTFRDAADLFEQYWDQRPRLICTRTGRLVAWVNIIEALVTFMSDAQTLDAPRDVVDEYASDATLLVSEGVLQESKDRRYSFFHESFFDYAFARLFARHGKDLVQFLLDDEQRLFRRAQVRQVLRHERATRADRHLRTLTDILGTEGIRFHLKVVAMADMGAVIDPREGEIRVALPLLERPADPLGREMWYAIFESGAWFRALDERGTIARFLASGDDRLIEIACWWLRGVIPYAPDRIAELLQPFVGASEAWRRRLLFMLDGARIAISRALFDLFLGLIDAGALDAPDESPFIGRDGRMATTGLETRRPDWACELVGHWLRRALEVSTARGIASPFDRALRPIRDDFEIHAFLTAAAHSAPDAFLLHVLMPMLDVMSATLILDDEPPRRDQVWGWRFAGGERDEAMALLAAAEVALATLARDDPAAFSPLACGLRSLPFETVHFLLIRAYAVAGATLADEAADYLLESDARLHSGYAGADYWATQQLLTAITPHCAEDRFRRLEQAIMEHYSRWERTAEGREERGYGQFLLLRHVAAERLSVDTRRRLRELERKFGTDLPDSEPLRIEAQRLRSPIPEGAVARMTDAAWRRALAVYDSDERQQHRRGKRVGGPYELAVQLEIQAMLEPARFVRLAVALPDDTHAAYFEAILRGTAKAGGDPDALLPLWQRCHALPNRPCGRAICHAIEGFSNRTLPTEALDLVAWYAVEAVDSDGEPSVLVDGEESIFTSGLNTTRGGAAFSMAKLLFGDESRLAHFMSSLEHMVADPSVAVRSWVAEVLTAALNGDREGTIALFERLCDTDDRLLTAPSIERFIFYVAGTHYDRVAPVIERMIRSGIPAAMIAGARQACRAALDLPEAQALAATCIDGQQVLRRGAAQIFAANIATARFRLLCEERLGQLFNDESVEVQKEAADCFRFIEPEALHGYGNLTASFAMSLAFSGDRFDLVHALRRCPGGLPDATIIVCERFLEVAGDEAGDNRTAVAGEAETVSQLVARLYAQANDRAARARFLDVVDGMLRVRAYGIRDALQDVER